MNSNTELQAKFKPVLAELMGVSLRPVFKELSFKSQFRPVWKELLFRTKFRPVLNELKHKSNQNTNANFVLKKVTSVPVACETGTQTTHTVPLTLFDTLQTMKRMQLEYENSNSYICVGAAMFAAGVVATCLTRWLF